MRTRTFGLVFLACTATVALLLAAPLVAVSPSPSAAAAESPGPAVAPHVWAGSSSSLNWAGYAVSAAPGSVSAVRGSWTVPAIQGTCPSANQYSSFWVGIDGFSSNTVEQTGTDSDCRSGTPAYYAWYEFYPKPSRVISSLTIHPGDVMSADVVFAGGRFTVTIADTTTGASYHASAKVSAAQRSSAEWIAEAPSSSGGILPLADFGSVSFGADSTGVASTCTATIGGVTGSIGSFGSNVESITMVTSAGTVKALPSSLTADGLSFSVAWKSPGP